MSASLRSLSVGLALAALQIAARAQGPSLSSIHDLPGDTAVGPAIGAQSEPAIAAGAGEYLVAWSDHRTDLNPLTNLADESAGDIYATRLNAAGHPIEATPIAISIDAGDQLMPRVAWNGTNWLVVWTTQSPTQLYWVIGIRAVRVAPDGTVLDPTPIHVIDAQTSTSVTSLAVASDGQNWTVVTQGTQSNDSNVVGVRVSPLGAVLDPTPRVLQLANSLLDTLDVAFAGGVYMLQWGDFAGASSSIRARRFDANLNALGAAFQVANTPLDDTNPRLASNGATFLSTWEMNSNTLAQVEIRAARVSAAGVVLDPGGVSVSGDIGPGTVHTPTASWDGVQWWVIWAHPSVRLARISAGGQVLDFGGFAVDAATSNFKNEPELAGAPTGGVQAVWMDLPPSGLDSWDINSVSVASPSQVSAIIPVALSKSAQISADVTAGSNAFAIAFVSALSGSRRVLLERLDALGNAQDAQPIELSNHPFDANPAVAWNGSIYLVVWQRNTAILARRVGADGALLDANPIHVMNGQNPDVAALGSTFLVSDVDTPGNPQISFVYSIRVDASGAVLGPRTAIGGSFAADPHVVALGPRWLVGWQNQFSHDDPHSQVQAAFVDANGASAGSFAVVGTFSGYLWQVRLAATPTEALIVWRQGSSQSVDVYAKRILSDGTLLDGTGVAVSSAPREQIDPTVGWDGSNFFVLYRDRRNDSFFVDNRSDVFGTRVAADATVLDTAGFAAFDDPTPEIGPSVAAVGDRTLLVSSRYRTAGYAAYRIGWRLSESSCASPTNFCTSLANSSGSSATIAVDGVASFALDDLTLSCSGLPQTTHGLFYFGMTPLSGVPFGNGLRCVGGATQRLPVIAVQGGAAVQAQDLQSAFFSGVSPGDVRYFQFWFRDVAAGGAQFNLSDALSLTFCD